MKTITIAAAQSRSVRGDIETNVTIHAGYVRLAANHSCNLIIFPELSLTGYEPDIAADLILDTDDK
jgi:predicted amidohydrolase